MNTKAILFIVTIMLYIVPLSYAKGRREYFNNKKELKKAKRAPKQGPPAKRFDDGTHKAGSVHGTYMHMDYEELEAEVENLIVNKYYDIAIKYIERMIAITTETEEHKVPGLLLKVADLWYQKEDYQKAWKAYAQWEQKYPGANNKMEIADMPLLTQAEYALFRAIESSDKCIQDIDRDQTQTHATIELTDRFLKKRELFKTYYAHVQKIRTACYERLIASDLSICSFYRKQGNNDAVQKRLTLIEEEYGPAFAQTKDLILTYRSTHYPETLDEEQAQQAKTLILAAAKPAQFHAADRF